MILNKKLAILIALLAQVPLISAMQLMQLERYSFAPQVQNFTQTNWLALQELNTLYEGRIPIFTGLPQQQSILQALPSNPINEVNQASLSNTISAIQPQAPIPLTQTASSHDNFNFNSYQNQFELTHAYNYRTFQQKQFNFLQKQECDIQQHHPEIYNTCKQAIIFEFLNAVQTLREASRNLIYPIKPNDVIAQSTRSWEKIRQLKFSNPILNNELQELITSVYTATTNPTTHAFDVSKTHCDTRSAMISKKIDAFERRLKNWTDNPLNLVQQALDDTHTLLSHHPQTLDQVTSNQGVHNQVAACTYNKNIAKMVELCDNGNFAEARNLASQYSSGAEFMPFQAIYETKFREKFTSEHIDKRFMNDPLYLAEKNNLKPAFEHLLSIPDPLNTELAERHNLYTEIIRELKFAPLNPKTRQLIYDVIGKERINTDITISPKDTFVYLATCPIDNTQNSDLIQRDMNYLKRGLSDTPEAHAFLTLANANVYALKNPSSPQEVRNLADYSTPAPSVHEGEIKMAALPLIADNIKNNTPESWELIKRIDRAVQNMSKGDIRADYYLQNGLLPTVNKEVLAVDYDAQMADFGGAIKNDAIVAYVQDLKGQTKVLLKGGAEFALQKFEILPCIEKFLIKHGLDPAKFKSCYGHQVQQAIHKNILEQIVKQHELSGLQLIESSHLDQLLSLTTQISDLSRQHNAIGNVGQAGTLSIFCWQTMRYIETASKYGWDTASGIGEGTWQGVCGFAHTITHPIEFAQNLGNLGLMLVKAVQGNELLNQMSIFKSHEENLRIAQQFKKEYGPIFEAIGKSIDDRLAQVTYKDVVRETTAFLVDMRLTNRTLSKLGEFSKIVSSHAAKVRKVQVTNAVRKGQMAAVRAFEKAVRPKTVAATAEGVEIKAAQAAENAIFNETPQIQKAVKAGLTTKAENIAHNEIKISSKVSEMAGLQLIEKFKEIIASNRDLNTLRNICNNLKNKVPDIKAGKFEEQLKNLPISKIEKIYEETEKFYLKMRKTEEDILKISKNLNLPQNIVEKIKSHLFLEEHFLDLGIMRFQADPNIANAWQRLIDGTFIKSDLILLEHEFVESLIANGKEVSYRIAHDLTNEIFNWNKYL